MGRRLEMKLSLCSTERARSRGNALAFLLLQISILVVTFQATADEPPRLLFLTHTGLYKHASLGPAENAVIEMGKSGGFEVTTLEGYKQEASALDLSMITPTYLSQ